MTVHIDKSNGVHFRNKSVNMTVVQFKIDMRSIDVVDHNTYLTEVLQTGHSVHSANVKFHGNGHLQRMVEHFKK